MRAMSPRMLCAIRKRSWRDCCKAPGEDKIQASPGWDSNMKAESLNLFRWHIEMRFRPCTVTVTQLPETLDSRRGRLFFKELESRMNVDRPCIVLDCSQVQEMDRFAIHMLLCCL